MRDAAPLVAEVAALQAAELVATQRVVKERRQHRAVNLKEQRPNPGVVRNAHRTADCVLQQGRPKLLACEASAPGADLTNLTNWNDLKYCAP